MAIFNSYVSHYQRVVAIILILVIVITTTDRISIVLSDGRRHQIRLHLAAAGFPVLGDDTYGGVAYLRKWKRFVMVPCNTFLCFGLVRVAVRVDALNVRQHQASASQGSRRYLRGQICPHLTRKPQQKPKLACTAGLQSCTQTGTYFNIYI